MSFDEDSSCSPGAGSRPASAAALAATTALDVVEEAMDDASTAVALPFRIGSSLCENRALEVTRLHLMTGPAASLQLDSSDTPASMAEGGEGDDSMMDDSLASISPFERLETAAPGSEDDDDAASLGPEASVTTSLQKINPICKQLFWPKVEEIVRTPRALPLLGLRRQRRSEKHCLL